MNGNDLGPLVSVVINCYNGEEYLKEALDSVFAQTFTNWEIVFWDNCSTDNSAAIAKSYGPKVKYYQAEKLTSLGEGRNLALAKVTGELITFIDCDDVWFPEKLEIQVDLMVRNSDYILCYASIEEVHLNGSHFRNVYNKYDSGYLFNELLEQFDVNILTSMINTRLLEESGLKFDSNITASEEYCLFMQLACRYKIGVIKEILAKYRVHVGSLTSKSLAKLGQERRYTLNRILKTNPGLLRLHQAAFKEAYARADYYDARWYMSQNQSLKAFRVLKSSASVNVRYFALTLLTLGPKSLWDYIHLKLKNRT